MSPPIDVAIRPYRLDDAATVLQAVRESVAEVQPWMPWCHPAYTFEDSRAWLEQQVPAFSQGTAYEFAIVQRSSGAYLGGCGLNHLDRENRFANLGYWVRSGAARRGTATAAACLLRDWAFANTELERLEIVIAVGNVASQRVAVKSGAVLEGVLRKRVFLHGVACDATMFSFTRP